MDSSSDSGRSGGQSSRRSGNRNRNRNRNRNSNQSSSGGGGGNRSRSRNRRRGGGGDGGGGGGGRRDSDVEYAPKPSGDQPPERKGLIGKIVGFFKGDAPSNKGTGRPIQTKRKRPGMDEAESSGPAAAQDEKRPSSKEGSERRSRADHPASDKPKRRRRRRGGRGESGSNGDREERSADASSGQGERSGGRGGRGGRSGGRGPRRERNRDADESKQVKREPRIVEVTSGRLYVGNLDYEVNEEHLEDLFRGFGDVKIAEIVTNQRTQQSKGFAFVEMAHIDQAKRAVEVLHDKEFMGRPIVVTGATSDGPVDPDATKEEAPEESASAADSEAPADVVAETEAEAEAEATGGGGGDDENRDPTAV